METTEQKQRLALLEIIAMIRSARVALKSDKPCIATKCDIAAKARNLVRMARDLQVVTFDQCDALQRALDY